ncbi:cupin domain-containing protein [Tardiphaga alba]|uniref:Cupin domain-containing protein n=1 Tax=Tardiphaga alba TaxID=340268 RepID=A0ABX8AFE0_9BRAD|nr:cupin domain-containing protein [Tardiphaga alba]QUS42488.1 cupin domain-containing protein [Tardiphaga alba]
MAKKSVAKAAAKAASRKSVAAKVAKKAPSAKPGKAIAKKALAKKAVAAPVSAKRLKQRPAISHYREEDFAAGLRAYAKYRDLGVAEASGGVAQAHVIRLIAPCDPNEVSKLHYHDAEFQLVYVLNGWVKTYMDGVGEQTMRQGSCWTQPPRIKHLIRDYSDNCELLEVILPAQFKTVEVKA